MFKFRTLIATGFASIAASFIAASMLSAAGKAPLTPGQEKAKGKCSLQYMQCVITCTQGDSGCVEKCKAAYLRCMDAAGIPRGSYPPPKGGRGIHHAPENGVTAVGTATPTPHKPKLSPDRTDSIAPVKAATPTPT